MFRLIRAAERVPPFMWWLVFACVGFVLLLASHLVGVASLVYDGRQVGYAWAPNWPISFILFFPLTLLFCTLALGGVRSLLRDLVNNRMLVNRDNTPAKEKKVLELWDRYISRAAVAVLVLWALALAWCVIEACQVTPTLRFGGSRAQFSADPKPGDEAPAEKGLESQKEALAKKGIKFSREDVDWSWGSWVHPDQVSDAANIAFNFATFLAQFLAAATFLLFVVLLVTFANLLWQFTNQDPDQPIKLIPRVDSEDPHRGFEVFKNFVENMLLTAVFFCCAFYMTWVQRIYLARGKDDIAAFLGSDVMAGFFSGLEDLFTEGNPSLFESGLVSFGSVVVLVAGLVLLALIILIPAYVLRQVARRSRDHLRAELDRTGVSLRPVTSLGRERIKERLNSMVFWPAGYPGPNQLIVIAVLVVGCFIFYKFTLLFLGLVFSLCVRSAVNFLKKRFGPAEPAA